MRSVKNYQVISLTGPEYHGLYVRFLGTGFQLRCNLGEASSTELSLDEVRALFASIASACESQEIVRTRIGRLSWTTDARPNPKHPDRLVVKFSGPLGLGHIGLSRRVLLSACEEFSSIYGQASTKADEAIG